MPPFSSDHQDPKALLGYQVIKGFQGARESEDHQEGQDSKARPVLLVFQGRQESPETRVTLVTSSLCPA